MNSKSHHPLLSWQAKQPFSPFFKTSYHLQLWTADPKSADLFHVAMIASKTAVKLHSTGCRSDLRPWSSSRVFRQWYTSSPWWRSWRSRVCSAGCGEPAETGRCRRAAWPGCAGPGRTPPEGWSPWSNHSTARMGSAAATRSRAEGSWRSFALWEWDWLRLDCQTCKQQVRRVRRRHQQAEMGSASAQEGFNVLSKALAKVIHLNTGCHVWNYNINQKSG